MCVCDQNKSNKVFRKKELRIKLTRPMIKYSNGNLVEQFFIVSTNSFGYLEKKNQLLFKQIELKRLNIYIKMLLY